MGPTLLQWHGDCDLVVGIAVSRRLGTLRFSSWYSGISLLGSGSCRFQQTRRPLPRARCGVCVKIVNGGHGGHNHSALRPARLPLRTHTFRHRVTELFARIALPAPIRPHPNALAPPLALAQSPRFIERIEHGLSEQISLSADRAKSLFRASHRVRHWTELRVSPSPRHWRRFLRCDFKRSSSSSTLISTSRLFVSVDLVTSSTA